MPYKFLLSVTKSKYRAAVMEKPEGETIAYNVICMMIYKAK